MGGALLAIFFAVLVSCMHGALAAKRLALRLNVAVSHRILITEDVCNVLLVDVALQLAIGRQEHFMSRCRWAYAQLAGD